MKKVTAYVPDDAVKDVVLRLIDSTAEFFVEDIDDKPKVKEHKAVLHALPSPKPNKHATTLFRDPAGLTAEQHITNLLAQGAKKTIGELAKFLVGIGYKESSAKARVKEMAKVGKLNLENHFYSLKQEKSDGQQSETYA